MPLRKALAYSKRKITSYTRRSKVKHLNYVKTVPNQRIVKFFMGNIPRYESGEYKNVISIIANVDVQIRDMALEAARQMLNNRIAKKLINNFYLACKAYPHQIIRENKTFSGGSKGERVQSGMAHSFGTSMYRSAVIKSGKPVFIVAFPNKKDLEFIRDVCKGAAAKLPCGTRLVYEELK